jgi:hypothetical protein
MTRFITDFNMNKKKQYNDCNDHVGSRDAIHHD